MSLKNNITGSKTYVIIDEYNTKNISATLKELLCLPHLRIILLGNSIDFCDRKRLELDTRNQFMNMKFEIYKQKELYDYAREKGVSKEEALKLTNQYCKAYNFARNIGKEPPNFRRFVEMVASFK
jgi:Cdc6-like AAA superfamily ATPase